jgi:hypothetical protein
MISSFCNFEGGQKCPENNYVVYFTKYEFKSLVCLVVLVENSVSFILRHENNFIYEKVSEQLAM